MLSGNEYVMLSDKCLLKTMKHGFYKLQGNHG